MTSKEKQFAYLVTSAISILSIGAYALARYIVPEAKFNADFNCIPPIMVIASATSALMALFENNQSPQ